MDITIIPDAMGGYHLQEVIVSEISPSLRARLAASRQLDCGKRQQVRQMVLEELPDSVTDRLFQENLVNRNTDMLEFGDRQDAEQALAAIVSHPNYRRVQMNPEIPCL